MQLRNHLSSLLLARQDNNKFKKQKAVLHLSSCVPLMTWAYCVVTDPVCLGHCLTFGLGMKKHLTSLTGVYPGLKGDGGTGMEGHLHHLYDHAQTKIIYQPC